MSVKFGHSSTRTKQLYRRRRDSFTLIELLTVILIIVILTGLGLAAFMGATTAAARSRARAEIQAISAALESYKADNGTYPLVTTFTDTNAYAQNDPSVIPGSYQSSSQLLFQALSGRTNYCDPPTTGQKSYMNFRADQLGNASAPAGTQGSGSTYIADPWGYSYGYSTGGTNTPAQCPLNGIGFFDLWSTAGAVGQQTNVNGWVSNWQQ